MAHSMSADDLLQQVITHSFDEIFITDAKGNVLFVSPSCLELYGVSADQLRNGNVYELERAGILSPSVTIPVLISQKPQTLIQHTLPGRTVLVSAYPLHNGKGELVGTLSFSRDITEVEYLKQRNEQVARTLLLYQQEIDTLRKNRLLSPVQSGKMQHIYDMVAKVADLHVTVLLEGESGVGKNRVAQLIHNLSDRKNQPFLEVNCGAIPESLIESELFGYEEGAFTGAKKGGKSGYFEAAGNGTLFLDEIGELSFNMQVKLLSVLQSQSVTRIGSNKRTMVRCRIICATNQNLEQLVLEKKFRHDLYYRINVIRMTIPPLRERREEIGPLIHELTEEINSTYKMKKGFSEEMVDWLCQQPWPGNVRELRNYIEKTLITSNDKVIRLSPELIEEQETAETDEEIPLDVYMEAIEKEFITRMYQKYPSSVRLAKKLGISQSKANRKIRKYCQR